METGQGTMNGQENGTAGQNWRFLWELKLAAQSVTDVYVSLSLLGGHYVRLAPKEFLDALDSMQAVSATHPHPKRFQFTMENDILWVHSSMMSKPGAAKKA